MRNLAAAFKDEICGQRRLAYGALIVRRDGQRFAYTSHDKEIVIEGDTYSPCNGIIPSNFQSNLKNEAANTQWTGFIDDVQIRAQELICGLFDGAELTYFIYSWALPPTSLTANPEEALLMLRGTLGKLNLDDICFDIEALSCEAAFAQSLPCNTDPLCEATFGDSECGIDINLFTFNRQVTTVGDCRFGWTGSGLPPRQFVNGNIIWTSGQNVGKRQKIMEMGTQLITTAGSPFYPIQVGDNFIIQAGCDRTFETCLNVYNNSDNFRGHPFVPSNNALLQNPQ